MKIRLALFCLALAATASAADVSPTSLPQPQPLAPSVGMKTAHATAAAKAATVHRVPAPTVSETSVTRQADGSLVMNCVQKPNPKLKDQMAMQKAASRIGEPQQP